MNNIRKIIEERLENAKLDLRNCLSEMKVRALQGQVEAYQDCLNLIPAPRTEQDILNDFEKLGYKVSKGAINSSLIFNFGEDTKIYIDNTFQTVRCNDIDMQEHKLLNELFEVIF